MRLDEDILDWFRGQVHAAGGGNYQTLGTKDEFEDSACEQIEDATRHPAEEEGGGENAAQRLDRGVQAYIHLGT
jgi:hypothetical protein